MKSCPYFRSMVSQAIQLKSGLMNSLCIRFYAKKALTAKNSVSVVKDEESRLSHVKVLNEYFSTSDTFKEEVHNIPPRLLERKYHSPDALYLIDTALAQEIFMFIEPEIKKNGAPIFETNPGLCLLSKIFLEAGMDLRLFESEPKFKSIALSLQEKFPNNVQIFPFNLLQLWKIAYLDMMDNGGRLDSILTGVEKREWSDRPILNFIGTLPNNRLLHHLVMSVIFQSSLTMYGRTEYFLLLNPLSFIQVKYGNIPYHYQRRSYTVLFNLLFDYEYYGMFDRKAFIPWQKERKRSRWKEDIDANKLYLVKITLKKDLLDQIQLEMLKPIWFFMKHHVGRKKWRVIPAMEQWVPNCGPRLIAKGIRLYTIFNDLSSQELLSIFKEFYSWPEYESSPFVSAVDSYIIKMTHESGLDADKIDDEGSVLENEEIPDDLHEDDESKPTKTDS